MSKILDLESADPNMNMSLWLATAPHKILLGKLSIRATILPVYQSKTRISLMPEPPANNRL